MKASDLRKITPLVKEYASQRGKHPDQLFVEGSNGLSTGAIVLKNLSLYRHPRDMSYCFANINGTARAEGSPAFLMQLQPKHDEVSEDAYRHYIEWMLNYSPWRRAFVSKSLNRALKTGVVVVDGNTRASTMMGSLIALRTPWETHGGNPRFRIVQLWWELMQKIDPKEAFIIANSIVNVSNPQAITLGEMFSGHSPIAVGTTFHHRVDNFINENIFDESNPWNTIGYGTPSNIWNAPVENEKFYKIVTSLIKDIGKDKNKVNVFGEDMGKKVFTSAQLVDCLGSTLPNMKEEIYGKA